MLAYVFWHWRRTQTTAVDYEGVQRAFHAALAAAPPSGFIDSFSGGVSRVPWVAGSDAYEDWYLVEDFGALGVLNEAAVASSRAQPHDVAAAVASGGAGGLYELKRGTAMRRPQYAHWFGKPEGMPYRDLFARLAPVVDTVEGALWMRQMVLGPAREFCLHAAARVSLPADLGAVAIPLRPVWPEPAESAMGPTR